MILFKKFRIGSPFQIIDLVAEEWHPEEQDPKHSLQIFRDHTLRKTDWVSLDFVPIYVSAVAIMGLVASVDALTLTTIQTSPQVAVGGSVRRVMWYLFRTRSSELVLRYHERRR